MYLVSVVTPDYVAKAKQYLTTLPLIRTCRPTVILLNFTEATDPEHKVERALRSALDWVDFRHLSLPKTHSHNMIQHCFLDAIPELEVKDTVCLTDTDVTIQRDFTSEELNHFHNAPYNATDIDAYYNVGADDTLEWEAKRIGLSEEWIAKYAPPEGLASIPCYNCGVMIGRVGTFQKVQRLYEAHCEEFYAAAAHRSRCQFLINWCWWKLGLQVRLLPHQIHQHAHLRAADGTPLLPLEANARFRFGTLVTDGGSPVVFRHAF
jgi:hypothetical protein